MRIRGVNAIYDSDCSDFWYYLRTDNADGDSNNLGSLHVNDRGKTLVAMTGFRKIDSKVLHKTTAYRIRQYYLVMSLSLPKLIRTNAFETLKKSIPRLQKLTPEVMRDRPYSEEVKFTILNVMFHTLIGDMTRVGRQRIIAPLDMVSEITDGVLVPVEEYDNNLPTIVGASWYRSYPTISYVKRRDGIAGRIAVETGLSKSTVLEVLSTTRRLVSSSVSDALDMGLSAFTLYVPYLMDLKVKLEATKSTRAEKRRVDVVVQADLDTSFVLELRRASALYRELDAAQSAGVGKATTEYEVSPTPKSEVVKKASREKRAFNKEVYTYGIETAIEILRTGGSSTRHN